MLNGKLVIILSLIGNMALAQTPTASPSPSPNPTTNNGQDAVYLNQNDKSPFSGYLLPADKLVELRNNTLERDSLKGQNDSLNTSLKLQDDVISKKDEQIN